MFFKIGVLKTSQYSLEDTCGGVSFLIMLQPLRAFFTEHLWMTASDSKMPRVYKMAKHM